MHGVHGNEISSSDAALAGGVSPARGARNADADLTLRDALVIIDPMENPDGRPRFVTRTCWARGGAGSGAGFRRARRAVAGRPSRTTISST